jgi:hypothetical protein
VERTREGALLQHLEILEQEGTVGNTGSLLEANVEDVTEVLGGQWNAAHVLAGHLLHSLFLGKQQRLQAPTARGDLVRGVPCLEGEHPANALDPIDGRGGGVLVVVQVLEVVEGLHDDRVRVGRVEGTGPELILVPLRTVDRFHRGLVAPRGDGAGLLHQVVKVRHDGNELGVVRNRGVKRGVFGGPPGGGDLHRSSGGGGCDSTRLNERKRDAHKGCERVFFVSVLFVCLWRLRARRASPSNDCL